MRKIMKFQWGNSLLRQGMGSITPLQSSSDLYTAMTGLQSANFDKFSPANNPLLQAGAASGDMASKALLMNANTNKAVNGLSKSAANMATGTAGSTVKPGGGLFSKANIGNTMSKAGGYADMIGSFIPKKEQSALTTGLNQGYDAAANMISSVPGVGTIVGGAMKIGGMLSDGLTALGVGTDQMTTTDKILDSKFMKLTPMGLVNAFGAKKADTIYKDNETWEQQGSAYGGSMAKVDDALTKSGKKYGAFSGKARRKANAQIAEAKRQQNLVSDINQEAQDAFAASNYSGIGLRNELALSGGYRNMAVGRNGMKILDAESQWAREVLNKAREVNKLQKGGKVDGITGAAPKITFESWYETVPSDRNDTTSYNLRRAFELAPKEELEAWRTSSVEDLRNGKNHLNSVYLNPKTGIYEFMKAKNHPTLKYELEWYNSKDPEAIKFRNAYDLDMSGDYYKYVPKKFAEGGKVNVIPDGALHAHKHHLEDISPEYEQVTSKGIPVVTEEEGGKLKQHAEIERNEIIFRLEVTKKLEELMKDGSDDAAIEAGKLLAHEIINNTVDNTGLMEVVE
ncbi:MAG: hypothetical protein [Bacteriophage sp.]|jgi:hypothetical protein|nr:MAG: hypothetical protein [Bacteriophage sp.]UVX67298.1 MAG: hypothetical protein [Bacteriophage sp.]UWF87323.1 MAG: hypothetical protein [Bacteriophage sp.]DAH01734.1 MAG TPA: hypothetical protein [Crassvirales sp.]